MLVDYSITIVSSCCLAVHGILRDLSLADITLVLVVEINLNVTALYFEFVASITDVLQMK